MRSRAAPRRKIAPPPSLRGRRAGASDGDRLGADQDRRSQTAQGIADEPGRAEGIVDTEIGFDRPVLVEQGPAQHAGQQTVARRRGEETAVAGDEESGKRRLGQEPVAVQVDEIVEAVRDGGGVPGLPIDFLI